MNLDIQAAGSRSGKKAEKKVRDGSSAAKKTGNSDLPRICFLIARPRSGTTVFSKMLGTHPRGACVVEICNGSNERSYFQFLKRQVATEADGKLPRKSHKTGMKYVD